MVWLRVSLGLAIAAAAWSAAARVPGWKTSTPAVALEWVEVRRGDLDTTLLAGGDLTPVKQTDVMCQVEDFTDSDGTTVLSVIANGSKVKKGDELCKLDSSLIEETARQQAIAVNQARALCLQARLSLETAQLELQEYQEGLVSQWTKEFEGRIALAKSDLERQADRLAWTETMFAKGYLSESKRLSERQTLAQARHDLRKAEGEFQVFRRFHVPKEVRTIRSRIETAQNNYRVAADRLKAEEDELAYLRKQIDQCIIRAPQDGVVVYTNGGKWWPHPLAPGTRVQQDQVLFVIPDLRQMEVEVSVHESMAPRVQVGMTASVNIASMGDRIIPGRVTSIDLLPSLSWKEWDERLRRFIVRVRLDKSPPSALPFMSASVQIDTGRVEDALVIPVEALAVVDGQQFCYVVADDGLHRRAITTRRSTTDLLEVTEGLNAGEHVVLRAVDVDGPVVDDNDRDPVIASARRRTAYPSRSRSREQVRERAS
jgi:HlyD family secretion protein